MPNKKFEIPYYSPDGTLHKQDGEAYIDDNDLRDLLIELMGDNICEDEIEEILKAASDKELSEEDFDKLVDEFILKNKNKSIR